MLCDLNVLWPTSAVNVQANIDAAKRAAADLAALGYHVIAYNQVCEGKIPPQFKKLIQVPEDGDVARGSGETHLQLASAGAAGRGLRALSRLTIVLDDPTQISSMATQTNTIKQFDLIAVSPANDKVWAACCQTVDCDIISLDMSQRLPFHFKHTMVGEAIRRGIVFEITYGLALKDNTAKRNFISNATNLIRVAKGKNVILSSGAKSLLDARAPMDVVNLGCLVGMDQSAAKHAISTYGRTAILHAETRARTYRAVASAQHTVDDLPRAEAWKAGLGGKDDFVGFDMDDDDDDSDGGAMDTS